MLSRPILSVRRCKRQLRMPGEQKLRPGRLHLEMWLSISASQQELGREAQPSFGKGLLTRCCGREAQQWIHWSAKVHPDCPPRPQCDLHSDWGFGR